MLSYTNLACCHALREAYGYCVVRDVHKGRGYGAAHGHVSLLSPAVMPVHIMVPPR